VAVCRRKHIWGTNDTVETWKAGKAMPAGYDACLWKFEASEIDDSIRAGRSVDDETIRQLTPMSVVEPAILTTNMGRRNDDAE